MFLGTACISSLTRFSVVGLPLTDAFPLILLPSGLQGVLQVKHLLPHNWPKKDRSVLGLGSRASLGLPVRREHEADDFFLPQGHGGTPVHTCLDGCSVHLDRPVCASSLICSLPTPWWFLSCRSLKADQS